MASTAFAAAGSSPRSARFFRNAALTTVSASALLAISSAPQLALAQTETAQAPAVEEIVVTGTRIVRPTQAPAAIGGVMANGNKPAMLVDGDASILMHFNEFDTMVRHKVPLLIVVQNNEMLGAEYYKLDAHKMDAMTSTIPTPDMGAVARGFGGRGVMATSIEQVRKAAAEWAANPGPMVIDVRISRSVISLPYRRIHYGMDE